MISDVIHSASAYFDIPVETITGTCRKKHLMQVRYAIAHVLRHRYGQSYPQIGRRLGGRDHGTIISGMRRFETIAGSDPIVRAWVDAQMQTPRHQPVIIAPAIVEAFTPPPPAKTQAPKPARPAKRSRKPLRGTFAPTDFADMKSHNGGFLVDDEGNTVYEHAALRRIERGTLKLLTALRREHPERCPV